MSHRVGPKPRSVAERFWVRVVPDAASGCWQWTGAKSPLGYGAFGIGSRYDGTARIVRAHRMAWELTHGPITDGRFVCHHCDNPPCCNPSHLFLGTPADNAADMAVKGRSRGLRTGTQNPKTKFSPETARAARVLIQSGVSQREVARRLGVSRGTVQNIINGKAWRHVD